ncbi:MAG: ClpXP protease specificity-enhancing factor [Methyloprofundus sp.]|nr:ClpXP protease specificity-enhancing factor [Methyloprofundus sp.]
MTPLKPYLIRSIYDWIIDNNLTPHLLVDATHPHAALPEEHIEDDKIVLNVRPEAINELSLGNTTVEFNARFNGQSMHIIAPVPAIMAIYARENGKGMVFDQEEGDNTSPPPDDTPPRSHLRVVK